MSTKRHRDPIGDLEASLFDVLGELRLEAQLLALKVATAQGIALALSEAHSRQTSKHLIELMGRIPARKARKGGHGQPS